MEIKIDTTEEMALIKALDVRTDAEAVRMKRYLNMPDLSRTEGSPIKELVPEGQPVFGYKKLKPVDSSTAWVNK